MQTFEVTLELDLKRVLRIATAELRRGRPRLAERSDGAAAALGRLTTTVDLTQWSRLFYRHGSHKTHQSYPHIPGVVN